MQTTCKLEGGGGQNSGNFANVIYERSLTSLTLLLSSSTIDKVSEIFGLIFEQNANITFEPIFQKSAIFGPFFEKKQTSVVFSKKKL